MFSELKFGFAFLKGRFTNLWFEDVAMNGSSGTRQIKTIVSGPVSVTVVPSMVLLLLMLPGAGAQQAPSGMAPSQPVNQVALSTQAAPTLADFAWLEGRWQGNWGPRSAEQVWMSPKSGLMLGTFRLVEDDKTLVIELFTLIQKPDGIEFRFRHFTPELVAWEKSDPTLLTLESVNPKQAIFVNPVDGQPRRSFLTRIDQDTYVARSEIVPDSGDTQVVEITYHRQKPSPAGNASAARQSGKGRH
jgi:hypothetical protein